MNPIQKLLNDSVDAVAPGLALAYSLGDEPANVFVAGRCDASANSQKISEETFFDLASITKPLCTAQWTLKLIQEGKLSFDTPAGRGFTVAHLLNHSSGLPAHVEYFRQFPTVWSLEDRLAAKSEILRQIQNTPLAYEPGSRTIYSDLGYLLLEHCCEIAAGQPLREIWPTLNGHGENALHFRELPTHTVSGYATTEHCPWRKRPMCGEVHDDNAWVMGGICGHAGLFGTIHNVHDYARRCIATYHNRADNLGLDSDLFRQSVDRSTLAPGGSHVLGWDTPSGASSSGRFFGPHSFGHLGFTGVSVWIDPDREWVVTLLTNRVCPSRDSTGIRALRPQIHDLCWRVATGVSD